VHPFRLLVVRVRRQPTVAHGGGEILHAYCPVAAGSFGSTGVGRIGLQLAPPRARPARGIAGGDDVDALADPGQEPAEQDEPPAARQGRRRDGEGAHQACRWRSANRLGSSRTCRISGTPVGNDAGARPVGATSTARIPTSNAGTMSVSIRFPT
jgi:hypothetical protein